MLNYGVVSVACMGSTTCVVWGPLKKVVTIHRPPKLVLSEPKLLLWVLVAPVEAAAIQEVARSSSAMLAREEYVLPTDH